MKYFIVMCLLVISGFASKYTECHSYHDKSYGTNFTFEVRKQEPKQKLSKEETQMQQQMMKMFQTIMNKMEE